MCGIVGLHTKEKSINHDVLKKMCDSITHRGPNDSGYYEYSDIGIAMRRLSIIDIYGGHQPISNENESLWIVFNGEIFNYKELREELIRKGHSFKTNSDTETILHLYEEKGAKCVNELRGMFAFAILNTNNRELFIARDRLGIKPLYYLSKPGVFAFGSEIKTLRLLKECSTDIDWQAFDYYFTLGYIPNPYSIYKDIRKLPPGHTLTYKNGTITIEQYWDVIYKPNYKKSEEEFIQEFTDLFRESVKLRLMSEVPLGAFLSGGIDSGLIVAMMAETASTKINTFTMGFGGSIGGFDDERKYARLVAERYGTTHIELETKPNVHEILDDLVETFDEPFADDSIIPSYYLCREARKHVTVALTGLGGDELFAGYERYLGLHYDSMLSIVPHCIRKYCMVPMINMMPELKSGDYKVNHVKRFIRNSIKPKNERYFGYISMLTDDEKRLFYSPEVYEQVRLARVKDELRAIYERDNAKSPLDKAAYFDIKTYLPEDILALTDRLSMRHSLELRVPFIDHKLVEFCATIPIGLRLNGKTKKYLLKKVASRYLPDEILSKRKQGFAAPMTQWIKSDLNDLMKSLSTQKNCFLNLGYIQHKLQEHIIGREIYDRFLFSCMMFNKWEFKKEN